MRNLGIIVILSSFVGALIGCAADTEPPESSAAQAVTTRTGIDYAWGRPRPSVIAADGYTFAARYLSYDTTGKNLTASEAQSLIAAGIDVVSNWEYATTAALNGYSQGVHDAQTANSQAAACGAPADRPIYFSVDFDATAGQQTAINAYFDGVASVIGVQRTGAYGGYYVIKRLFDAGKITFGWQTYAWSGGQWDPRAQARQVHNGVTVDGVDSDVDIALTDDFGQWGVTTPKKFESPAWRRRLAVDLNGDKAGDICARGGDGLHCALSNASGFPTQVAGPGWSDAGGWGDPKYYSTIQFADVNGDGKADVCGRGSAGIYCELSDGTGFPTEIAGPAWSDAGGWGDPKYYSTIQFADVNGDGKADLCGRGYDGIFCELSDGTGFPTEVVGPAWSDPNGWGDRKYYATIQFADVNGDGKADVCGRASDGILCSLSNGTGFPTGVTGPAWSDGNGWGDPVYYSTIQIADLDGDGKADLCGRAAAGVLCELSNGESFPTELGGPPWSDANGWNHAQYYDTFWMLGPPPPAPAGSGSDGSGSDGNPGTKHGGGCSVTGDASGLAILLALALPLRRRRSAFHSHQ